MKNAPKFFYKILPTSLSHRHPWESSHSPTPPIPLLTSTLVSVQSRGTGIKGAGFLKGCFYLKQESLVDLLIAFLGKDKKQHRMKFNEQHNSST